MSGNAHANKLIHETSPYLLQHARNPVDWRPWGDEAFLEAKRTGKPVLLSIGYSSCHWCHVMAHESFENEDIAKIMNEHFVNIKVDREERPDLDQIYQTAVQFFLRRGGGWPLTMFLTPEKAPFHGGTYFPPEDRFQLPGFPRVLLSLSKVYKERGSDVAHTAGEVLKALAQLKKNHAKASVSPELLKDAAESLSRNFDTTHGGFGGAPKFPGTPALTLLLRYYHKSKAPPFLEMVTYSLRKMACGGVYDQIGGGFHRYAVDEAWQVPHFEKMLYDNAQLVPLYFETFQASGDLFFKETGIDILEYVLREMTDQDGGFYAAEDADSEGGEGAFYTWSPQEVRAILGEDAGALLNRYYQITESGNFEGKTIPHRSGLTEGLAEISGKSEDEAAEIIRAGRETLRIAREKRPRPFRDEKIIVSWNSLMISAFTKGYAVCRDRRYLSAAAAAADFILEKLYHEGRLLHTYKNGAAKLNAYLDDAAYFSNALVDLYEASSDERYLEHTQSLADRLIADYWDADDGGFFYTSHDHEVLIDRTRPIYDQSVPSGNSTAAEALLRLFYHTGKQVYFERAEKTLLAFAAEIGQNPFGTGNMIAAADLYLRKPHEIHVAGDPDSEAMEALLTRLHRLYLPNKVLSFNRPAFSDQRDWVGGQSSNGEPVVTLCHNFSCSPPLTDWDAIEKQLSE
ncbi:MAG: thioredoxin domain-containing protein [Nitrospiria bacterium]